jgi:putative tricarboxylic transport membrane protein
MAHLIRFCVSTLIAASVLTPAYAASWEPKKTVELMVGSSPGSGTDATARVIQRILEEKQLVDVPVTVLNKPGGGSAIVFAYLASRAGDPHYLDVASYNLVTNQITGKSKIGYADFTPIAFLFNDYVAFNVRSDSKFKSGKDLVEHVKADPRSVTFGLSSSVAGANHIALALVMKRAGIDIKKLKVVVFNSGGESSSALLGGHVDVQLISASVGAKLTESGKARVLAVASPSRLNGALKEIPTWRELGIPVTATNWRILMAPKGITKEQIAFWETTTRRLTETAEWKKYLDDSFSDDAYLNSAQTQKFFEEEHAQVKEVLMDLGLAK